MNVKTLVLLILGALLAAGGLVLRALARKFPEPAADAQKEMPPHPTRAPAGN